MKKIREQISGINLISDSARAYDLLDENEKSKEMLDHLPFIFGDRSYWEAEIAYADKKYDLALKKIKESFSVKARFISRCIRMAAWIAQDMHEQDWAEKSIELNEYMLRIINAFLSGGEYLPNRQICQKTSLLCKLVEQYASIGNVDKCLEYIQELEKTQKEVCKFLENPKDKHCFMFLESNEEAEWDITKKMINETIIIAKRMLPH